MDFVSVEDLLLRGSLWLAEESEQSTPRAGQAARTVAPFGVHTIDSALPQGGLPWGSVHEFFSVTPETQPATLLCALAGNVMRAAQSSTTAAPNKLVLWIGRECWPTPHVVAHALQHEATPESFLSNAVFLDPPSIQMRLWAIELALRSPAVAAVIAPLQKLSFALTRRFALAARDGGGMGFFMRPYKELAVRSAALSRWRVLSVVSEGIEPRWSISLCRFRNREMEKVEWIVEGLYEEGKALSLHLLPPVVKRSAPAATVLKHIYAA